MAFVGRGINTVRTVGDQSAAGVKTFTDEFYVYEQITIKDSLNSDHNDELVINGNTQMLAYINRNVVYGTNGSDSYWPAIVHVDVNKKELSHIGFKYAANKDNTIEFKVYQATSTLTTDAANFSFHYGSGSVDPYFKCYNIIPYGDNTRQLGSSSFRWKQLYAGTATINTSDEREKQQIDNIPDNVLDAWADVKFCQFKFNNSVAEKGDAARLHTGLIAQRIKSAFEARNLNAADYGLFCHDAWEESDDTPAGDRYALRYEECLTLEAAFQRRRADRIEARLETLEKALKND